MQEILRLFSGSIEIPPSPLTSVLTLSQTWSQCEVPEACSSPGTPSPSTNMSYLHCKASPEFLNLTRQTPYNLECSLHISSFGHCTKKSPGSSPGLLDPAGKTPLCTWQLHWQPEILREGSGGWPAAVKPSVWPIFSVQIESLEEKHLPARSLKIMAEAFAIKGLCYEKLPLQVQNSMHSYIYNAKLIVPGSSTY